jgi:hypothetical protein
VPPHRSWRVRWCRSPTASAERKSLISWHSITTATALRT